MKQYARTAKLVIRCSAQKLPMDDRRYGRACRKMWRRSDVQNVEEISMKAEVVECLEMVGFAGDHVGDGQIDARS